MGNELFNSIVSKVAVHIPMFAKAVVEAGLEKVGANAWTATPLQMKRALDETILPKLRKFTARNQPVDVMGGGIIRTTAPFTNAVKPAGQWNRYQIIMKDTHLVVFLNGELIQALDLSRSAMKDRSKAGYISFQDEAKVVSYRNIRIKELK